MAFIVQALQIKESEDGASMIIADRQDALETALRLSEDGHVAVRIIGDGRIYNPTEFALTVPAEGRRYLNL
jgi:hypothetical protein